MIVAMLRTRGFRFGALMAAAISLSLLNGCSSGGVSGTPKTEAAPAPEPTPVVREGVLARTRVFEFHGGMWSDLHHFLYVVARSRMKLPDSRRDVIAQAPVELAKAELSLAERESIDAAVAIYAKSFASRDLVFDAVAARESAAVVRLEERESTVGGNVDPELAMALELAAPAWRRAFWPRHSLRERAWLQEVLPILEMHSDAMVKGVENAYGVRWPAEPLRVDLVAYANWAGAFARLHDGVIGGLRRGHRRPERALEDQRRLFPVAPDECRPQLCRQGKVRQCSRRRSSRLGGFRITAGSAAHRDPDRRPSKSADGNRRCARGSSLVPALHILVARLRVQIAQRLFFRTVNSCQQRGHRDRGARPARPRASAGREESAFDFLHIGQNQRVSSPWIGLREIPSPHLALRVQIPERLLLDLQFFPLLTGFFVMVASFARAASDYRTSDLSHAETDRKGTPELGSVKKS